MGCRRVPRPALHRSRRIGDSALLRACVPAMGPDLHRCRLYVTMCARFVTVNRGEGRSDARLCELIKQRPCGDERHLPYLL